MDDAPYDSLPEEKAQRRFDELQAGWATQWRLIGGQSFHDFQELVVVPSVSLELDVPRSVLQMYEERDRSRGPALRPRETDGCRVPHAQCGNRTGQGGIDRYWRFP